MSFLHFQQIKRFIHICDHTDTNGSEHFFNRLDSMMSSIIKTSKHLWRSETTRRRNEPIGSGFNIWALCDAGYMYHSFSHSNRNPWKECMQYKIIFCHASAVVSRLCNELLWRKYGSAETLMYFFYMDNLVSTPNLFSLLC